MADVSLIMPAYNAERFIIEALGSLGAEQPLLLDIIVVDDGSADGTAALVAGLAERDRRIRLFRKDHGGLSAALNFGLSVAGAEFVTFLDSDDLCPPGRIRRQVAALRAEPGIGALFGDTLVFEEQLEADLTPVPGSHWERVLAPSISAGTFRREALSAIGPFDEAMPYSADIDLLLRLHDSVWPIRTEAELGLLCRKHGRNMSNSSELVRIHLLAALRRSIIRRRQSGRTNELPPFALMKPLSAISRSEEGIPGHRASNLDL